MTKIERQPRLDLESLNEKEILLELLKRGLVDGWDKDDIKTAELIVGVKCQWNQMNIH